MDIDAIISKLYEGSQDTHRPNFLPVQLVVDSSVFQPLFNVTKALSRLETSRAADAHGSCITMRSWAGHGMALGIANCACTTFHLFSFYVSFCAAQQGEAG